MYVIVIGCGRLGGSLATELSDAGHDVCVIDRDKERLSVLGSGFNGKMISGIEYDGGNLEGGGIQQADALLAVTSDDNINITVSLIANRIYHVPQVAARVNVPGRKYIYEKLDIGTISPVQLGVEMLMNRLNINRVEVLSVLDDSHELICLTVSRETPEITVCETQTKHRCSVSAIIRDGNFVFPSPYEPIFCGDRIICAVAKKDKEPLLKSLLKEMPVWSL